MLVINNKMTVIMTASWKELAPGRMFLKGRLKLVIIIPSETDVVDFGGGVVLQKKVSSFSSKFSIQISI